MTTTLILAAEWQERGRLRAEGSKLRAEFDRLYAEGGRLYAEGARLRAEGARLWVEGDLFWANAVLARLGDVTVEWFTDGSCRLGNGEVYEPERGE